MLTKVLHKIFAAGKLYSHGVSFISTGSTDQQTDLQSTMPAVNNHSDDETSKSKANSKSTPVEGNGAESESDGEGGSEYEIEEVLDAKRGYFPDVCVIILETILLLVDKETKVSHEDF